MSKNTERAFTLLLICMLCLQSALAVKCYSCEDDCNDGKIKVKDCGDSYSQCQMAIVNKVKVHRSCSIYNKSKTEEMHIPVKYCFDIGNDTAGMCPPSQVCFCSGDLCNGSDNLRHTALVTLISAVTSWILLHG